MTNQSLPPDAPRPSRTTVPVSVAGLAECVSCGREVQQFCDDCQSPVCSVCFTNIHLQATGCFGVYDNDAQPSWYGLATGLARRQG